jgi:hypothetical protein
MLHPFTTRRSLFRDLSEAFNPYFFFLALIAGLFYFPVEHLVAAEPDVAANDYFERQIRPLLSKHCTSCHGGEKQESDLRLDVKSAAMEGGATGQPAIVPGKATDSLLFQAVNYHGDIQMPPDGKISDAEILTLKSWIDAGAAWPDNSAALQVLTAEQRIAVHRAEHWAYQPIQAPQIPTQQTAETAIDAFVLARLAKENLDISPEADRRVLIRRLTQNLHGLPPTWEEVQAFEADTSPDAYERLVDRLLASPRYGERWGRHWLDVARYADTKGYAFAKDRRYPFAYTYRDYVIDAFNADISYHTFVKEQLAADWLADQRDGKALAGLGFLTVGRDYNRNEENIDDKIDTVTRGLLGLTVSCARCHDHKYDALPTEDYYSLYGIFASVRVPDELPLLSNGPPTPEFERYAAQLADIEKKREEYNQKIQQELIETANRNLADYLVRTLGDEAEKLIEAKKLSFIKLNRDSAKSRLVDRWRDHLARTAADHHVWAAWKQLANANPDQFSSEAERFTAKVNGGLLPFNEIVWQKFHELKPTNRYELANVYGVAVAQVYEKWKSLGAGAEATDKLTEPERQVLREISNPGTPHDVPIAEIERYFNRAERDHHREFGKQITALQATSPGAPPRAMVVVENERPHDPVVFIRGNPGRRGKRVPRQFPSVLSGQDRLPFGKGSGRLELAQAIVHPDNPLTDRVIVNRVWQHHFGQPLVVEPSDFGIRGDPPSHPGLLDYLVVRFRESGGSLKSLHREILLSATYRQSSAPRADAAAIDPENRLLARMNRQRLSLEAMRDNLFAVSGDLATAMGGRGVDLWAQPFTPRRAIYGTIDRQDLPGVFRVFDYANPDAHASERPKTTTPQQALFFMNSPLVISQAKRIVAVCKAEDPTATAQNLVRNIYGRDATAEELDIASSFVATAGNDGDLGPWERLAQTLLASNEFLFVD